MIEPRFYSIEKAAVEYLTGLDAARRASDELAVQKFVRWFGRQRGVDAIRTRDIDGYCDTALPAEASALRGFLSYTYKKGLSVRGLASHVKSRKDSQPSTSSNSAPDDAIHVTVEGLASLRSELANLKEQSITVTDQMRKAAADKDFRENAPLHAAREQKSHIEGRIQEIQATLSRATTVNGKPNGTSVILGDTVLLTDLKSGTSLQYKLVDSREASPAKGKLSASSPIGRALLGKHTGDEVECAAPAGTFRYKLERLDPARA
jgi:transcription elongation factor GreA